ncbi:glycosyltransferase family 2 protein [uncultured Winogradskyella sp.]|uniref:glycosyltransferase family 2 protein n=1 Tax=uncultured Winogradskyella sp. TaxID=395353 RepID=UPI0035186D56
MISNQLVTVILPNYNHEAYLKTRLDSIYNQTYQNYEVILLDDCSSDSSLSILSLYKNHPKTSYFIINKKNSGSPFKQWQKGFNLAKGKYIWIAESDDFCDLNFLESQLQHIQQRNLDVVVAETKVVKDNKVIGRTQHPIFKQEFESRLTLDYFLYCPILNVSSIVFEKSLIKNVYKFTDFRLIGDRVFYFEAFHNKKIALNPLTQSYFRKEGDSLSTLSTKDLDYLIKYYCEHQHFAKDAYRTKKIDCSLYRSYVKRFFNRVKNRLSLTKKLNVEYIKILLKYYIHLHC